MQELQILPSSCSSFSTKAFVVIPAFLVRRQCHFPSSLGILSSSVTHLGSRHRLQSSWSGGHGCMDHHHRHLSEGGNNLATFYCCCGSFRFPFLSCYRLGKNSKCKSWFSCSWSRIVAPVCAQNLHWHDGCVEQKVRQTLLKQKGCIIWITGLSGSGKSTLACTLDHRLASMGHLSYVLDGDNIRHGLSSDLRFSAADREENIRRVGEVAKLFADAGVITLVSFISPYAKDREFVRSIVPRGEFIEVFMKVPLEVCEARDCKGLYKSARAGVLKGFTGVDDPYEEPQNPEIVLEATDATGEFISAQVMASTLITYIRDRGFLEGPCS
ncbi:unnamed protein product [Sphagnum jensenii]|uniref:Adenylyl-sulfate kinase n=1 Tax=Sphagnum jensenii TaxID=128206 RepID=A0ABP0XM72_9BRYO